jgi:hypothetical protein
VWKSSALERFSFAANGLTPVAAQAGYEYRLALAVLRDQTSGL